MAKKSPTTQANWAEVPALSADFAPLGDAQLAESQTEYLDLDVEARLVVDDVEVKELHDLRDHGAAYRTAARRLGIIPSARQVVHIVAANMAMFDYVPGIIALAAPATITRLAVSSLTCSKANVEAIVALLDAGTVGAMDLLLGDYFEKTSPTIYGFAITALSGRPGVRVRTCRTHCKVVAAELTDGRWVTLTGSPNLRSSRNVEQVCAQGGREVFEFHAGWIAEVCDAASRS